MYFHKILVVLLSCYLLESAARPKPSLWDQIPIISQIKSLVQVAGGDAEGARKTQDNFSKGVFLPAPIVRSIIFPNEAKETWSSVGKNYEYVVDGVPIIGHAKAIVHYATGDQGRGDEIIKSASRPIGVVGGGVGGFILGGPPGAVAGGLVGGAAVDGIITGIESAINKEYRPYGNLKNVGEIIKDPKNPGKWFETTASIAADGASGYFAGSGIVGQSSPYSPIVSPDVSIATIYTQATGSTIGSYNTAIGSAATSFYTAPSSPGTSFYSATSGNSGISKASGLPNTNTQPVSDHGAISKIIKFQLDLVDGPAVSELEEKQDDNED